MDGVVVSSMLQPPPVSLPRVGTWDLLSAEEGSPKGRAPSSLLSNPSNYALAIEDQLQAAEAGRDQMSGTPPRSTQQGKKSWQQDLDSALADMFNQQAIPRGAVTRARWSAGAIARADAEDGCAV
jgi:hypothetical protein